MLKRVFENSGFVAVDKPAGWLSVPSRVGETDPRSCVGTTLQQEIGHQIYPVHRLDLEVSGILLFAKNPDSHKKACRAFEHGKVEKLYEAWTLSDRSEECHIGAHHRWSSLLVRGKKRTFEAAYGKPSLTLADVEMHHQWQGHDLCIWRLQPVTGRSHQLRFELAKRGLPIVGDALYGSKLKLKGEQPDVIALRCFSLSFLNTNEKSGPLAAVSIKIEKLLDLEASV